jgi:SAM-dependent methyltransferase
VLRKTTNIPKTDAGLIYGNVYDKYGTRNPVERYLMHNFLSTLDRFVAMAAVREIHEVGCGEGSLVLRYVQRGFQVRGSDASAEVIDIARKQATRGGLQVPFTVASIYDLDPHQDAAPLLLCSEVLEHLEDPDAALAQLAKVASPYLIASVPREPLWRALNMARGKYWSDLGNTPGHLQHWSSAGFKQLLERHMDVVALAQPLPWTVALCRTKGQQKSA